MSDLFGRWVPGLDLLTGTLSLSLPLWAVGVFVTLFVASLLLVVVRAGRKGGFKRGLARLALIVVVAMLAWHVLDQQDIAGERKALEARMETLRTQATLPGSRLACLDAMAGPAVEGACERSLFASPEALASAVSYVEAQLRLFADASRLVGRGQANLEPVLEGLRSAIEGDRYGLVAHVLATRDGCTVARCPAAALMRDARRVTANLTQRTYDAYVSRHSSGWPAASPAPGPAVAAAPPPPPPSAVPGFPTLASPDVAPPALPPETSAFAAPPIRPPGPDVFFPTSDTIPPINIMTAEPNEPATTGSAPPNRAARPASEPAQKQSPPAQQKKKAAARPQKSSAAPQQKKSAASQPKPAAPAEPPININPTARGGAPSER